jgi:hypothetical protein
LIVVVVIECKNHTENYLKEVELAPSCSLHQAK